MTLTPLGPRKFDKVLVLTLPSSCEPTIAEVRTRYAEPCRDLLRTLSFDAIFEARSRAHEERRRCYLAEREALRKTLDLFDECWRLQDAIFTLSGYAIEMQAVGAGPLAQEFVNIKLSHLAEEAGRADAALSKGTADRQSKGESYLGAVRACFEQQQRERQTLERARMMVEKITADLYFLRPSPN